jgi:hypothetical protein
MLRLKRQTAGRKARRQPRLTLRIPGQTTEVYLEKIVYASVERPGQVSLRATGNVQQVADLWDFELAACRDLRKSWILEMGNKAVSGILFLAVAGNGRTRPKCACGKTLGWRHCSWCSSWSARVSTCPWSGHWLPGRNSGSVMIWKRNSSCVHCQVVFL